jgi:hypothetical protein
MNIYYINGTDDKIVKKIEKKSLRRIEDMENYIPTNMKEFNEYVEKLTDNEGYSLQ